MNSSTATYESLPLERLKTEAERWIAGVTSNGSLSGAAANGVRDIVQQAFDLGKASPSTESVASGGAMPDMNESGWMPEQALRFYAEGRHFDIVDGRTRILDTGAVASDALKGMSESYAAMKGVSSTAECSSEPTWEQRYGAMLVELRRLQDVEKDHLALLQSLPSSIESTTDDDAACKRAADLLRAEIKRLEYPRAMVPQERGNIDRRIRGFEAAILFLDPEAK